MKQTFIIFFTALFAYSSSGQNTRADSLLNIMRVTKSDSSRIRLMNDILYKIPELTQPERIDYSKKIRALSKKLGDKILESEITAEMGYIIAINGNNLLGSELAFEALEIALKHGSKQALGVIYQDLAICFRDDTAKRKEYLFKALPNSEDAGDYSNLAAIFLSLSKHYSNIPNKDSALFYAQRAYQVCLEKKVEEILPSSLVELATINYSMFGDKGIAYEYMRKALNNKYGSENPDAIVAVNASMGRMFLDDKKMDSAIFYANKAFANLYKARFIRSLDVYSLYKDIYTVLNSDSAVKYYKLHETAKDSIAKMSNAQQQQLLSIKKDMEIEKEQTERQQNIQYALIALGLVIFVILFFLFSHSIIANQNVIKFLGILALLIVFEFLNLFLHPFLDKITNHQPVLMLAAMVCIAALLIPFHHKLEHWITHKMVEKNKKIRLAAAKKTIAKLETEATN